MSSNEAAAYLSDQSLLRRASAGDLEAFGVIYGRYRQVVYRFARAMTGTADAADDITHDAFLAVLEEAARFDARRASLSTYLYGIVRNLCRGHLRRASRLQSMDGHAGDWLATAGGDPLADAQMASLVRRALTALPSRYRELVLLCDVHELSYADAAQVVGASVPAVRSRLHRGRRLLRAAVSSQMVARVPTLKPARCAS